MGGQIGYGETNNTRKGDPSSVSNVSRKYPPSGRRKASESEMAASRSACAREAIAPGSCSVARAIPPKLDRSGESPPSQLSSAPAHDDRKFARKRRHSWMFFQV